MPDTDEIAEPEANIQAEEWDAPPKEETVPEPEPEKPKAKRAPKKPKGTGPWKVRLAESLPCKYEDADGNAYEVESWDGVSPHAILKGAKSIPISVLRDILKS